ncbi:MAG: hypothetical protein ABIU09_06145 [Pyrinomonadaceae bacterium]
MAIDENITITETASDGTETDFEITTAKADDLSGDDKTFAEAAVEAMFDDESTDQEASYMDYDGDGKLDSAAADTDGDGEVDTAAADTDGDGKIDAVGKDTDGDGNLDVAVFDTDGDGQADASMTDTDGDGEMDAVDLDGDGETDYTIEASEGLPTEEEISANSVEFTVGEDGFPIEESSVEVTEEYTEYSEAPSGDVQSFETAPAFADSPVDSGYSAGPTDTSTADTDETAAQQTNVDAAKEAQAAANEFVAQGDYAAAAEARAVAENAAYEAGDSSMLGVSDASDLENAAYKQEVAEDYRQQQQENIAEGDYAAAKEDAQNAGYATGDADYLASGSDHTGQSDNDVYNLDNAVYQEKNADAAVDNAGWYAAQGDADGVERNLEQAGAYQASADDFASNADQESYNYQEDPSSLVETGGTYDAGTYDAASAGTYDAGAYDTSIASVDTGIDTSVDASAAPAYDTTADDTV